jgi:glutaredoxin
VKEFLSREHVPFVVRNVDEDDAAYDELLAHGFRAVPVTIVGDQAIAGFDPVALRHALAAR